MKKIFIEKLFSNIVIIQYIICIYTRDCSLRISICGDCFKKEIMFIRIIKHSAFMSIAILVFRILYIYVMRYFFQENRKDFSLQFIAQTICRSYFLFSAGNPGFFLWPGNSGSKTLRIAVLIIWFVYEFVYEIIKI